MPGTSDIVEWVPITREFYTAAGSLVRAEVGTNVYNPDLPAKTKYNALTTKGVVISSVGGAVVGEQKVDMPFQAKCYGGSQNFDDAQAVAKAFVNQTRTAHGTNVASGRVIGAQVETWGQQIRESGGQAGGGSLGPPLKYVLVFGRIQVGPIAT